MLPFLHAEQIAPAYFALFKLNLEDVTYNVPRCAYNAPPKIDAVFDVNWHL